MHPTPLHALRACTDPSALPDLTKQCLAHFEYLIDRQLETYHQNRIDAKRRYAPVHCHREKRKKESDGQYFDRLVRDRDGAIADDFIDFRNALAEGLLNGFRRLRERDDELPENVEKYLESCLSEFAKKQYKRDSRHVKYGKLNRVSTPQFEDENGDSHDDYDAWPQQQYQRSEYPSVENDLRPSAQIEQRQAMRRQTSDIEIADEDTKVMELLKTHSIKDTADMLYLTTWQVRQIREKYRPHVPPAE